MKALCYHGVRDIRYESYPDPQLQGDGDVLVKMEKSGICGSDLHIYHGHGFSEDVGFCVGHEAVGEVVEVGMAIRRVKPGDKVMLSAAVSCGACSPCLAGDIIRCINGPSLANCYGLSHQLEGCQAEMIRVPAGDFNATLIPEGITPNQALMLTDNLPTAYFGCKNGDIGPGKTAVVVGLGPIGQMAVECALMMGASQVFAVDPVSGRRAIATDLGATALDPNSAVAEIAEVTHGRMIDCAVEAAGLDETISLAIDLAGTGGTVSVIGVNLNMSFAFPMGLAFGKSLTFRIGTCSVPKYWPELVPLIRKGRLHPERFITHEMPLSKGAETYRIFDARENGALKMVLTT